LLRIYPDKMMLGVAPRKILGKEELEGRGFYVWDLDTFSGMNG
jgi:hypothetical protein